jgi:hypothetical protein
MRCGAALERTAVEGSAEGWMQKQANTIYACNLPARHGFGSITRNMSSLLFTPWFQQLWFHMPAIHFAEKILFSMQNMVVSARQPSNSQQTELM